MTQDEILICRRCKVAAKSELVDDQIVCITCPSCGVLVEGDAAHKVYLDQMRYYNIKKAQDILKRGFRKDRSVDYRPGHTSDPGGPFIIGIPHP